MKCKCYFFQQTGDDFYQQAALDEEEEHYRILHEQVEEKRFRDAERLAQEAYEDQIIEENAIRHREQLRLEWEEEQELLREKKALVRQHTHHIE